MQVQGQHDMVRCNNETETCTCGKKNISVVDLPSCLSSTSERVMKPYPFEILNHLQFPVAKARAALCRGTTEAARVRINLVEESMLKKWGFIGLSSRACGWESFPSKCIIVYMPHRGLATRLASVYASRCFLKQKSLHPLGTNSIDGVVVCNKGRVHSCSVSGRG